MRFVTSRATFRGQLQKLAVYAYTPKSFHATENVAALKPLRRRSLRNI
jgi:hypothetical protein